MFLPSLLAAALLTGCAAEGDGTEPPSRGAAQSFAPSTNAAPAKVRVIPAPPGSPGPESPIAPKVTNSYPTGPRAEPGQGAPPPKVNQAPKNDPEQPAPNGGRG